MINKKILIFILFTLGVLLRAIHPTHYIFNFDQEQIALNATNILKGKLTLIGPKVGPAEFFQPPLMYYLAAPFYALGEGHPISGTYLSIFMSAVTGIVIYLLFKRFESEKQATASIFIWSTSIFLISMDRTTWLVNLMILSSTMVYFGLKILENKHSYLLVSIGLALALNAHVSSLILLAITIITYIKAKKTIKEYLVLFVPMLILVFLPLLLFDLRHDFMSSKGLKDFIFNKAGSDSPSILYLFTRSFATAISLGGRIILEDINKVVHIFLGGLLILYARSYLKNISSIVTTWVLTFITVFGFYGGHLPEYYFLMLVPVFLDIYTRLWKENAVARWILVIISVYSLSIGLKNKDSYKYSMQNKIDLLENIIEQSETKNVNISLSLPRGDEHGFIYLVDYMQITQDPQAPNYTIYSGNDMPNQVGGYHFIDSSNN